MITINDFSLDSSFTLMTIDYSLEAGDTTQSLKLFIGDQYLSQNFIDLTHLAIGENVHIELPIDSPELIDYTKTIFDGAFTITIESAGGDNAEAILINAFYPSICFANLVVAHDSLDDWNELNMLYMLLQAALTYAAVPQIEQAITAYSKVEAICKSKPEKFFNTDVSACGQGLGCWIVNGLYILNR